MASIEAKKIGRDQVQDLIHSVIQKVEAKEESSRDKIATELRDLQSLIESSRKEISETNVGDVKFTHVPTATDELGAVVAATEAATSVIMDSCDIISAEAEKVSGDHKDVLISEVTKILEACSFQDITGQRITKVMKNLKSIEEKVGALLQILAEKMPNTPMVPAEDTRVGDERLKNGPQMPDQAVSQADIDKLLADLF